MSAHEHGPERPALGEPPADAVTRPQVSAAEGRTTEPPAKRLVRVTVAEITPDSEGKVLVEVPAAWDEERVWRALEENLCELVEEACWDTPSEGDRYGVVSFDMDEDVDDEIDPTLPMVRLS